MKYKAQARVDKIVSQTSNRLYNFNVPKPQIYFENKSIRFP